MTSIIGYTRAPFNLYCSIAPVKKLYQQEAVATGTDATTESMKNVVAADKKPLYSPNFYRIFTRDSVSSAGIIEIIKNKQSLFLRSDDTASGHNNTTENRFGTVSNITVHATTPKQPLENPRQAQKEYSVCLSIELENKREFDSLFRPSNSSEPVASYTNIERVMESLSELAYNLTMKFVNVLDLLKKLLLHQERYQFLSCIDKQQKTLSVYFPTDLTGDVGGTYVWLKNEIGIDISTQQNWQLVRIKDNNRYDDQKASTTGNDSIATSSNKNSNDCFDGKAYFEDIHKFIDQVDALIQSNGLFSHPGSEQKNQ